MMLSDHLRPVAVTVLGAGAMGAGIALLLAGRGHQVAVHDPAPGIAGALAEATEGVTAADTLEAAVEGADVVFEAVPEDLDIKHATIARTQAVTPEAVIASNTSTFSPTELSAGAAHPDRILVAHFFNPADIVALVELVGSSQTAPEAIALVERLLVEAGKRPVTLRKERVGFVANRLQAALHREALALLDEGVLCMEDLDAVVTHGLGPRWAAAGPFMVMDLGGLDVWQAVLARLQPDLDASVDPSPRVRALVESGKLGAKAGSGFYAHGPAADKEVRAEIARNFRTRLVTHP